VTEHSIRGVFCLERFVDQELGHLE
jgi:hypothetical protein